MVSCFASSAISIALLQTKLNRKAWTLIVKPGQYLQLDQFLWLFVFFFSRFSITTNNNISCLAHFTFIRMIYFLAAPLPAVTPAAIVEVAGDPLATELLAPLATFNLASLDSLLLDKFSLLWTLLFCNASELLVSLLDDVLLDIAELLLWLKMPLRGAAKLCCCDCCWCGGARVIIVDEPRLDLCCSVFPEPGCCRSGRM